MRTGTQCLLVILMLVSGLRTGTLYAAEYLLDQTIAPESVLEVPLAMGTIADDVASPPRRTVFNTDFSDAAPFWRDSESLLDIRVYNFERDDGSADLSEALAAGSDLTVTSGKWRNRFSVGATWHTSNGIDAPKSLGGTGILGPNQSDMSVISRAYVDYDISGEANLRLYRQDFDLPYLNQQDSRMIPNTHEAYVIQSASERLQYIAGHVNKMKRRTSERFVSMGEIAGVEGSNVGTNIAGAQYKFLNDFTIGGIIQHTDDLLITTYLETSYSRNLAEEWDLRLTAQHTDQRSNGSELLGRFQTHSWGLRSQLSFRGAIVTAAYTEIDKDAAIQKPFGGTPGFTSSMLFDFDRAGEKAWRLGLSQNFASFGAPGISLVLNYTDGHGAILSDGSSLADEKEFDITLDFRPQGGLFEGLWLRVRKGEGDRSGDGRDRNDLRVILKFNLDLLR